MRARRDYCDVRDGLAQAKSLLALPEIGTTTTQTVGKVGRPAGFL